MRTINFAKRNFKEIIRDPLSIIFSIILPLFLLFIFQQFEIPNDVYKIENFTPGIIIFSFSFISLFTATLVAKDRTSSLLMRLCASPMKPVEYILGYIISVLPIVIFQNILFFICAFLCGLKLSINVLFVILISIVISILFILIGIIVGSITTEKASSGVASVIVQLVAFTSGMYFSNDMLGKFFKIVCDILPFSHSLNIIKGVLNNNYAILLDIFVYIIYLVIILVLSILIFNRNLKSDK